MAATSSSTSATNHTPTIRYDVFLSFRGEDTRHNFTDHLYHALIGAGLRTFRDNDEIGRGQELAPEIMTAINESRASVVVLSKNYANSRWCLDELFLILEQRRTCGHFVLPVFFHVDPSDVRNQRGSFAVKRSIWIPIVKVVNLTGLLNCLACFGIEAKQDSKWTEVNVRRWKAALTEVSNFSGLELSRFIPETNIIDQVVETVNEKLDLKQLSIPTHLIGIEARVDIINSWFKNEECSAIVICGMGGSGKTTLAQHIYNLNKQDFKSSSFIEVTGKQPYGLLGLQKQLLKDILGHKKIKISSVSEGTQKIEQVLQMKRVLVVLDDIDNHEKLDYLLGTKVFPKQSKIIITTRLLDICAWFGSKCWVHKINLLNDLESLELLSWHAFGSKIPMVGFKEYAVQLAKYCEGNPLALKVLGSSLFVSNDDPWNRNNMIEVWISRINSLNTLKASIDSKIQCVLQKSFDSLPLNTHKELFLHIACFFIGDDKVEAETILEDQLSAKYGILTLINRCLLTISPRGELMMHQLLQEMGRNIVNEESKDPGKRSRVWRDVESFHVLRKKDGSDIIEGLALDMRKVEHGLKSEVSALETSSIAKLKKLKLLLLKHVELTGSYENFPELIWLCWHGCPLQTIPSGLLTSSLVDLDMSHGLMEMFEAPTVLYSLRILRLKGCRNLVSIHNFQRLPKLGNLDLCDCSSLTHIGKSLEDLENLEDLNLAGCTKLSKYVNQEENTMLPHQRPSLSLPQSLQWLSLAYCGLEFNNDVCVTFHANSFVILSLTRNPFEYLPNSINLKMLRILNLYCCPNLKSLPCIPSTLVGLQIDWCTSLERVTFESGRFTVHGFTYEGCFKLSEIQGLFKLVPIAKINEADLGDMKWIKAYENHRVDLVGDDITKGRIWYTQMLYEYGIVSTYLQGIKEGQVVLRKYEYMSSSESVSFIIPCHREKNRTEGLNNGTMIVSGCGASLVYIGDSDVERENNTTKEEEVIGGDLTGFEVTMGGYYLCRHDFFGSGTSYWLKCLFGENIHYTDTQEWRKTHQKMGAKVLKYDMNTYLKIIEVGVSFNSEGEIDKIEKAVYDLVGVESVSTKKEMGKLIVTGHMDPVQVATCVMEFDNMVEILSIKHEFEW